jgi:type I restriction enzyme R subunit/putative DNA methylase
MGRRTGDPAEGGRASTLRTPLDRTYGSCFMRDSRIARIMADAIVYFDEERYSLLAWCVMPNHVHVVMENVRDLHSVVNSWKSFTSKKANAVLGRVGTFWQADYFDRCIRDSRERHNTIEYVLRNPEAAGLRGWEWVRVYPERLK